MSDKEKTAEEIAAEAEAARLAEEEKQRKKKVKFDKDQQEILNSLYGSAFAEGAKKAEEAAKKAEEALAKQLADEKAAREALAKQVEDLTKKKEDPKPEIDQFKAQMDARMTEMQNILNGIKTERDELKKKVDTAEETARKSRKKDMFLAALKDAEVTFYDPLEAYALAEGSGYEWDKDKDRPVILNPETNQPKLNENGEPMNVIDFVKSFAEKKKYLVKAPDQQGGTGSGGERRHEERGTKTEKTAKEIEAMSNAEFEAFCQQILNKPR